MAEEPSGGGAGEYADALSQIIERDRQVRAREARPRPPRDSSGKKWAFAWLLIPAFVVVWLPVIRQTAEPPPSIAPQALEFNERVKTFAVAAEVRRFQEENGRLPTSLDEIGLGDTGLRLVVISEGEWRVQQEVDGEAVESRSSDEPLDVIMDMVDDPIPGLPGG